MACLLSICMSLCIIRSVGPLLRPDKPAWVVPMAFVVLMALRGPHLHCCIMIWYVVKFSALCAWSLLFRFGSLSLYPA